MSEQNITSRLVLHMRKQGFQVQRIESRLMKGIPDINFCSPRGAEGWIEMKNCKKPPSRLELTPEQFLWLRTRATLNHRVYVVFYIESSKAWCLVRATQFKSFTANPLTKDLLIETYRDLEQLFEGMKQ